MRHWLRAPALHFVAVGSLLFAARAFVRSDAVTPRVGLSPEEVIRLGSRAAIDEEILHREALALGLDRQDGAARERLARLGEFVGEDGPEADEEGARRLGLERRDVVVRRHLASMMQLAAGRLGPTDLPTAEELRGWFDAHGSEFAAPARVRFTHVYLARDRHGAALEADADRLMRDLRALAVLPEAAAAHGEAFLSGAEIGPVSSVEVARVFGADLAQKVERVPIGEWVGPFQSPYGLHAVWVRERTPPRVPPFETVRSRVLHRVLRARSEARARERLAALRVRYGVLPD